MIDQIKTNIQELNDTDFQALRSWVFMDEVKRRESLPAREDAQVGLIKDLADQGEITRPEVATEEAAINGDGIVPPWVDPAGKAHKAYFVGAAVLDDGRIYINRKQGLNFARPNSPDSGWELYNPPKETETDTAPESVEPEAPTDDAPGAPAWREPQSKTDVYAKGAEVSHNGAQWRSTDDGNRAEPGTDDSWEKIEG
nr:MAG TPA: Putative transmembrane protein [Caudoviricetes sp.]